MRNDTYDELDDIPSVVTSRRERGDRESSRTGSRYVEDDAPVKGRSSGVLWAIVVALLITLGVLGWWSYRQIAVLEQQLVATQESFARISEEAAGRIQDISGKVVANESNVSTGSEALQGQVRQLQRRIADMGKQQQALIGQLESMVQRMDGLSGDMSSRGAADDAGPQVQALASQVKQLSEQSEALASQQKTLASEQAELKQAGAQSVGGDSSAEIEKLNARMNTMATDLNKLRDRNPNDDIQAIRQDITVLRSQLENRNNAEFDAFRGQMTRNINSLQGQLQSLQQQINAR
jgi:archaellum component FlaC